MYLLRGLVRLSRPLYLLFAALTYTLGAGIARYLGTSNRLDAMVLGLGAVVLIQAAVSLLAVVFRPLTEPLVGNETQEQRRRLRIAALYTSASALAASVLVGFALQRAGGLSEEAALCMALSLLFALLYGVPPARVMDRGFGELVLAVQMAYLAPALGFLLQVGDYHPLLNACIVALTLLLTATLVALEFPSFASDLKLGRSTVLTRMGWENALRMHHALVGAAYVLLGLAALLGFSFNLFAPAFLTVPFALLQVLLLRNIALGAKPVWNLVSANAVAIYGLTAYFLTLSFWIR